MKTHSLVRVILIQLLLIGLILAVHGCGGGGDSSNNSASNTGGSGSTAGTSGGNGDIASPTVPSDVHVTSLQSTKLELSWTASTDDSGVAGYHVYRDGVRVGTATGGSTAYTDSGLDRNTAYTYSVSAYDPAGNESPTSSPPLEVTTLASPLYIDSTGDESGNTVAVDADGYVYIAGQTKGDLAGTNKGGWDIFVAKYDSSLVLQWTHQLGTAEDDAAIFMAGDGSGVYVTGYTKGALFGTHRGNSDFFVAKLSKADGSLLWGRQDGTLFNEIAYGLAVDSGGSIYITGYTQGTLTGQTAAGEADIFVAKYDSSGTQQWVKQVSAAAGGTARTDLGYSLVADTSGNVYVTGYTGAYYSGGTYIGYDLYVAKLDSNNGVVLWHQTVDSLGNGNDIGYAITLDSAGNNLYIAGSTSGSLPGESNHGGSSDAFLANLSAADGTLHWARQFGTTEKDVAMGVSLDHAGHAYVAGGTYGSLGGANQGSSDLFWAKYDLASGNQVWAKQTGIGGYEIAYGVAFDGTVDVGYISGYMDGAGSRKAAILKFGSDGSLK